MVVGAEAAAWLHRHGAAHGLCRTFTDEPWHFELVGTSDGGCPEPAPGASRRQ